MVTYCKLRYRADSTSGYLSVTNCSHQTCCSNQVSYRINCFITKRHQLWICIGKEGKSMAWDFNLVQFSALQSTSSIALGKSTKTSVPFRSATTAAAWGLGQIEALGVRCFDVCKVPPSSKDAVDMKVSLLHGALAPLLTQTSMCHCLLPNPSGCKPSTGNSVHSEVWPEITHAQLLRDRLQPNWCWLPC